MIPILQHDHLIPVCRIDVLGDEVPECHQYFHEEVRQVGLRLKVGNIFLVVVLRHLTQDRCHHSYTVTL